MLKKINVGISIAVVAATHSYATPNEGAQRGEWTAGEWTKSLTLFIALPAKRDHVPNLMHVSCEGGAEQAFVSFAEGTIDAGMLTKVDVAFRHSNARPTFEKWHSVERSHIAAHLAETAVWESIRDNEVAFQIQGGSTFIVPEVPDEIQSTIDDCLTQ